MRGLLFTPEWRSVGLALLLLPLLFTLGLWQLERAEEKRVLQSHFEDRKLHGPVDFEALLEIEDLRYQPVRFRGEFINQYTLFLDNRIHKQQFGYEVITPFKLSSSNLWVFVNRGWVPGDRSRRSLPNVDSVNGIVDLIGEIYVPQSNMLTLGGEELATEWPRVTQTVDVAQLSEEFSMDVFPFTIRLRESSPGLFKENWLVVNLNPEKHTGYAVQWFSMSVALCLLVIAANTNIIALMKKKKVQR
jgi:surfeit locus 1 family protein